MLRKCISLILLVLVLFMLPGAAFAQGLDTGRLGSVSVSLMDRDGETPIVGAELSLYYVAFAGISSNGNLSYTLTDAFENCGAALDDPSLSEKLDAFVEEHSPSAEKLVTDAHGSASFTALPLGLYFVKQTNAVEGYAPCTSFLVTVPNHSSEGYVYDVNASPKTDIARLTALTIKKVWNTGASGKAADSVTVQLLRNGVVVETATLSEENNWQITYPEMPESDGYSIKEVNVPRGFAATYSQNEYVFTVTNTVSLIQTGQLLWPIPVLALSGLILITLGTLVIRKSRNSNG